MKSSRAAIIWSALAICALAVLGAMTLLTRDIRASQREHALAETRAELEENTRLALWRIDAAGSDILLRENQRPPSDYNTSSSQPSAPFGNIPAVRLHFQIRDGLLTSPDASGDPAKTETLRQLLTANGDIRSLLERAAQRHQAIRRNWEPETTTQLKQKAAQARQAPTKAQRSSTNNQADYNRIELAQRSKLFSNQNPGVNAYGTYLENLAPQAGPNDTTGTAPAILEITGLSPSWIGAELFLIRNITREPGADDIIQGVWLDPTRLKQHLLAEITDLLPDATLEPLPTPVDDPLALVSFPFLLHRGQPPAIPSPPWNRALLTGWAAVLLALLAVTILVRGIMRLSERRASFVSAVTHELRTPLTTFRLYSEMLEGGVVKKQNQSQYLRVLTTEADRLTHLVENVLAFSRIERGNARSQIKTIPVGELLESFRDRLESRLASASLTLDMQTDDTTAVRADTAAVEHILFNLIDNAAKYAANSTPPAVEIRTRPAGKHLAISVRDHGPGIPAADRSRIFRPFHKSARQAAESKPGVGLGLALSKRLATSQHGNLTYTATAFELTLPTSPPSPAPQPTPPPPPPFIPHPTTSRRRVRENATKPPPSPHIHNLYQNTIKPHHPTLRSNIHNHLQRKIKSMTNLRQQTESQIQKTRQANPEFMQAIDDIMKSAHKFKEGGDAIAIGQPAPAFELPNASGETVSLSSLLANGPMVVSFYRGSWCPYCNLELRALQARLPDIHSLGAALVAISPQMPDESLTRSEKELLEFPVLSDQDARVASQYGVAWKVPELILNHMRVDRNLDLEKLNNGNGSILPIPATFVIGRDGVVKWRFVDVDYRKRAEPEDIVTALRKLVGNSSD